jgi:hypothetical protein
MKKPSDTPIAVAGAQTAEPLELTVYPEPVQKLAEDPLSNASKPISAVLRVPAYGIALPTSTAVPRGREFVTDSPGPATTSPTKVFVIAAFDVTNSPAPTGVALFGAHTAEPFDETVNPDPVQKLAADPLARDPNVSLRVLVPLSNGFATAIGVPAGRTRFTYPTTLTEYTCA